MQDGGVAGGIETRRNALELQEKIQEIDGYIDSLVKPEKAAIYIDGDNTIWFFDGIVFPSSQFISVRQSMNPQITPDKLADQCKYFLEKADEAGIFKLVPGIERILNKAKARGIEVVVATNRPERLRDVTVETLAKKLSEAKLDIPKTVVMLGDANKAVFIVSDIQARNKEKAILIDDQSKNAENNGVLHSFVLPTKPWVFSYEEYRQEIESVLALSDFGDKAQQAKLEVLLMSALLSIAELQGNKQREKLNDLLKLRNNNPIVKNLFAKEYLSQFASELTEIAKKESKGVQGADGGEGIIDVSDLLRINSRTEDKGGIDLRAMPIVTQPMKAPLPPVIAGQPVLIIANLDAEWRQIEGMVAAKMIPSSQRIKEFLVACCAKGELSQHMDDVLACIADILRMEEEKAVKTEPALKDVLILLESDIPAKDLQSSLSRVTIATAHL
jgi:hypothetical protein